MKIDIKKAAFSLASVAAASVLGMLSGGDMKDTYLLLKRPWYAPPPVVFPAVWSILYLLMAYALYQALTVQGTGFYAQKGMLITFLCGLLLSALWPMAFSVFSFSILPFISLWRCLCSAPLPRSIFTGSAAVLRYVICPISFGLFLRSF